MKRFLIAVVCLVGLLVQDVKAQSSEAFRLATTVTNMAANTTNTTASTVKLLSDGNEWVRVYLTATGYAATTNGALTAKLITASGSGTTTNAYDSAALSNIKLVISNSINGSTITVSDRFNLSGAKYLAVGQIENSFAGSVSNISIQVGYPLKRE